MKKNYTLLLLTVLLSFNAIAQAPAWAWAHEAGTAFDDMGMGTATDASGNVFVCGTFNGPTITFGGTTLTNAANGQQDVFLVKYNSSGLVQWARSFGNSGLEQANGICTDAAGNVIITGYFDSPVLTIGTNTLTLVTTNTGDFYIAKYNTLGAVVWAKSVGGSSGETGRKLACDASGNIYVAGTFSSTNLSFGSTLLNHQGSAYTDVFLVKYDAAGTVQWAKTAGGSDVDDVTAISTDASGNIFMTGDFKSQFLVFASGTLPNIHAGTNDTYLLKFNPSGTVLWGRNAGTTSYDYSNSVCVDASGNSYISGTFGDTTITFGSFTLHSSPTASAFFVKYDTAGTVIFADTTSGQPISNYCVGNHVYVGGNYYGSATFGSTTLTNTGNTDVYIVQYDLSGNVIWANSGVGDAPDYVYSLTASPAGSVIITGQYFSTTLQFGSTILSNTTSSYNFYIAQLGGTSVGITENTVNSDVLIYPNPATNQLSIISYSLLVKEVKIYNMLGECVLVAPPLLSGNRLIDVSRLSKGIYSVQIQTTNGIINKKIIKD